MSIGDSDATKMLEIAGQVLAEAKANGADRTKVVGTVDETLRIKNENREFTMANSLSAEAFGLGVHKDHRKGSAVVNSTNMDDLRSAMKEALGLAKYSIADEFLTMPTAEEAPKANGLDFLYDDSMLKVSPKEIEELMSHCLSSKLTDPRISVESFEFSIGSSVHTMMSSEGVVQKEKQTGAGWSVMGMARDGDEVSGMDYLGGHSFTWAGVAEAVEKDCEEFARTVLTSLNPIPCPNYRGIVVLSPRAVRPLIISTMLYHTAGSSVMDGKSRWADKIGESVASDLITLTDNPHDPLLAGATSYDSDGLPTSKNTIIENGKLAGHLHSCYTAKRTGKKSNAQSGGPFGMTLQAGKKSKSELLQLSDNILLVNRFSGNVDPLTGDFSGVAKSSHLYTNGENMGPVKEVMIAGNVFDIMKNIAGISTESMNVSAGFNAPWVAVDGVAVS